MGNNAANVPTLRRISFTSGAASAPEDLIEGVQDIRVLYGIAGSNRQVTNYVSAASVSDWNQVVSVRVYLLLVSTETNVVAENVTVDLNGTAVTVPHRRLAQVFSATIGIRNRLP